MKQVEIVGGWVVFLNRVADPILPRVTFLVFGDRSALFEK